MASLSISQDGSEEWAINYGGLSKFQVNDSGSGDKWNRGTIDCSGFLEENDFATFMAIMPDKENSANCTINGVILSTNGRNILEGELKQSSMFLCCYDKGENIIEMFDIEGMNQVTENLGVNLKLKDSEPIDVSVYSKTQMDGIIEGLDGKIEKIDYMLGKSSVEEFDEDETYHINNYVLHENRCFRCLVDGVTGPWIEQYWIQTSGYAELKDLRHVEQMQYEHVTVEVRCNDSSTVSGTTVTFVYNSQSGKPSETIVLDETGIVEKDLEFGVQYSISVGGKTGYISPANNAYMANKDEREILLIYKLIVSGIYVIDNNGNETDIEFWDPANNDQARFIKYTSNVLYDGGDDSEDNSIIISKQWASQMSNGIQLCPGWIDVPLLSNYEIASQANTDYKGKQNNEIIKQYDSTKFPAINYCINITEILLGKILFSYLPSMGQLRILCDNGNAINNALLKIGSNSIGISSGDWWSSSERNNYGGWHLHSAATASILGKDQRYKVLPLFSI